MSYKANSWKFMSNNGYDIILKMNDSREQFSVFYDSKEDQDHIWFDKKDIPDLIKLLLEIQAA